jgi:signal peptidase I
VALALALGIQAFLVKPYRIPTESMVPTLEVGQRVLVSRVNYHFGDPGVGDVVVFNPPAGADRGDVCGAEHPETQACPRPTEGKSTQNFIKRIVAGPGDRLAVRGGRAVVNGEVQRRFGNRCEGQQACDLSQPITVPPGHYFMMGDNRGSSDDSRFWGPVPRSWIIGEAFGTYWPPDRIGGV